MCQPYQGLNFQIVFVFIVAFVFVILFVFAFVINFFICICVYELCTSQVGYHVSALSGPARLLQPSTLTPALYLQIDAMHYVYCNTPVTLHSKTLYCITDYILSIVIIDPTLTPALYPQINAMHYIYCNTLYLTAVYCKAFHCNALHLRLLQSLLTATLLPHSYVYSQ